MGILDFFRKKRKADDEMPEQQKTVPETGSSEDIPPEPKKESEPFSSEWNTPEGSLSNSLSKDMDLEFTDPPEIVYFDSLKDRDSISNEMITKGISILDTYEVVSEAIKGGMGSVWKVHHQNWNVFLAMKRPLPKYFAEGSSNRKAAFIRECEAWVRLGLHPNIVSCYYVREIGGVPSIFSEWMENGSLKNRIDDGTLYDGSDEEVRGRLLDIAIQSAKGLHYAHESEDHLIHQDVKPDNMLLTDAWEAKISDFGLAKARVRLAYSESDFEERGSEPGATVITPTGGRSPAYCSPEQAADLPLTRRTDIYSWAVSVMEMYLGKRPWSDGVDAGLNCREYLARTRVPMPKALKALLIRCLEQAPENRPHDFAAIDEELKQIYRDDLGSRYPRRDLNAAKDTADSLNNRALTFMDLGFPEKAAEYWEMALEKEPDHQEAVYNQGLYLWRNGQIDYEELARRCVSAGRDDAELRDRLLEQIQKEQQDVLPKVLVKADDEVAEFGKAGRDAETSLGCAVSPDGKWVYLLSGRSLRCYDARTLKLCYEETEQIHTDTSPIVSSLLVTEDGKYLMLNVNSRENRLLVADAATGKILRELKDEIRFPGFCYFCLHPDNRHCFSVYQNDPILKWNIETGQCEMSYPVPAFFREPSALCLNETEHRLYAASYFYFGEWDEDTGERIHTMEIEMHIPTSGAVSADRNEIYVGSWQGGMRYKVSDAAIDHPDFVSGLRSVWNCPDRQYLLKANHNHALILWDMEKQQVVRTFQGHLRGIRCASASDDLSLIVTSGMDGAVLLWDTAAPVNRAPWELNRIRAFSDQMFLQRKAESLEAGIQESMALDRNDRAVTFLEQAEEKFAPHLFFSLRRDLAKRCHQGELTDVYEITHFPVSGDAKALWGDTQHPCYDPKSGRIAAASRSSFMVRILDEAGDCKKELPCERVNYAIYSPAGRLLAAAANENIVIFDAENGTMLRTLNGLPYSTGFDEPEAELAISPDEKWIIGGAADGFVGIWDINSGELLHTLTIGYREVVHIEFIGSDNQAVIGTEDCTLVLLDAGTGEILRKADTMGKLLCAAPDGKTLYLSAWGDFYTVIEWDVETWSPRGEFKLPNGRGCEGMTISRDGLLMAAGGSDGVTLLSLPEKKLVWESGKLATAYYESRNLAFSPDGCALCVGKGEILHILALRRKLHPR